jgi:hypothetical protein
MEIYWVAIFTLCGYSGHADGYVFVDPPRPDRAGLGCSTIRRALAQARRLEDLRIFRSSGSSVTVIGIRLRLRLLGSLGSRGHDSSVIRSGTNYRRESRRLPRLVLRRLARPLDLPVVLRLLTGMILESNQGRSPGSQ